MIEFILGVIIGHFWSDIYNGIKTIIIEVRKMIKEW